MRPTNLGPLSTARVDETLDAGVPAAGEPAADRRGYARRGTARSTLVEGTHMGRYVIERPLGWGTMGTVYVAYDPDLDRRVALKLLRGGTSRDRRRALLGEARALAKLTHPNVVAVYDVGQHDGQIYVAMELVEGTTLRAWLDERPRHWRDVVDTFVLAGRGLRAAHARGLVHRDFKPDNVMVSADGRVRVMDFGLASGGGCADLDGRDEALGTAPGRQPTARPVRVAGTPAYMAPEHALLRDIRPAVDQFSFCVSLWEGVAGRRPFGGDCCCALLANVIAGRVRPPTSGGAMPPWLRRALRRGLRATAADRWPSMDALLDVLERRRRRRRWHLLPGLLSVAALPASLLAGPESATTARQTHIAAPTARRCGAVWDQRSRPGRAMARATGRNRDTSAWRPVLRARCNAAAP
ncbi:MAG: serine/threonine-protein kinase [Myxococcota bacterium]